MTQQLNRTTLYIVTINYIHDGIVLLDFILLFSHCFFAHMDRNRNIEKRWMGKHLGMCHMQRFMKQKFEVILFHFTPCHCKQKNITNTLNSYEIYLIFMIIFYLLWTLKPNIINRCRVWAISKINKKKYVCAEQQIKNNR